MVTYVYVGWFHGVRLRRETRVKLSPRFISSSLSSAIVSPLLDKDKIYLARYKVHVARLARLGQKQNWKTILS